MRLPRFRFLPPLAAVLLLPGCANGLFYHPTRAWDSTPETRGHPHWENATFRAEDGVLLHAWWIPAHGNPRGTVVHFHGNARNIGNHIAFSDWLPAAGYNLLLFDYRGYGRSQGAISRHGLVRDGQAALAYAAARPETPPTRLLVWGQSLGGTIALQALARSPTPVAGALIDSTFENHPRIAAEKMRGLPWWLAWLRPFRPLVVSGGHDADDALPRLHLPLFFLHGQADRVIPPHHSQRLFQKANAPRHLWIVPGASHCDAVLRFPDLLRPEILRFFADPAAYQGPSPGSPGGAQE